MSCIAAVRRAAAAPLEGHLAALPALFQQHAADQVRTFATGEANSDSQPIPKPRRGSLADVADRPPPPEAKPVIEPGMDPSDWDPSDPKYQRLTKQLVWAVKTRPAPEATESTNVHEPTKALPADRHTDARSGNVYEEDVKVGAGRLNVLHLKEIYLKRFEARSQGNTLEAGELAKEYGIDPGLLEKVFKYTELPIARQDRRGRTVGLSHEEALQLAKEESSMS
ncbi:hypothetical protein KFL_003750070 [Klebsormidium nitens]|uniref:Uncharacterized protein n=1 Tax=Klebsormidium nitens TaxID=105231 RepID=A0A1Y1IGA5_KLENI|nr:hypothetical protein KFL_003750070 [Klebsormidium nitens]|eukprot:GAQ87757.1 hypothetical protein KFL_003750070 [Klebsormidium nitens]